MRGIAKMRAGRALAALGACVLALAAALGWGAAGAGVALADEAPAPYAGTTYAVTVYAGNQGTVGAADRHVIEGVPFGGSVSFDGLAVAVPDDGRYYAKGLRLAGLDNVAASADAAPTFYYANADASGVLRGSMAPVTEDVDLVVAYGIMADRVQYVVRYVDADGAELAPAQTFFGDIGDVPATAPAYVEGYLPDALVNFLALIGWSLDGETTVVPPEELCRVFSLDRISKKHGVMDPQKLDWMNGVYLREMAPADWVAAARPWLAEAEVLGASVDGVEVVAAPAPGEEPPARDFGPATRAGTRRWPWRSPPSTRRRRTTSASTPWSSSA